MVNPLLYETIQVESAGLHFIKLVKIPLMLMHYGKILHVGVVLSHLASPSAILALKRAHCAIFHLLQYCTLTNTYGDYNHNTRLHRAIVKVLLLVPTYQ